MRAEHLAKEAERLKDDPIFNKALDDIKAEALALLVTADADDKTGILRLQQRAQVSDSIRTMLDRYIMAGEVVSRDEASPFA